jgi:hypothetical protein
LGVDAEHRVRITAWIDNIPDTMKGLGDTRIIGLGEFLTTKIKRKPAIVIRQTCGKNFRRCNLPILVEIAWNADDLPWLLALFKLSTTPPDWVCVPCFFCVIPLATG